MIPNILMEQLTRMAVTYKDLKIHCNTCQYEGLVAEFQQGCPRCHETTKLTPLTASGQNLSSLGLQSKSKPNFFINWQALIIATFIFIAYKLLSWDIFIPLAIGLVVIYLVISWKRNNEPKI